MDVNICIIACKFAATTPMVVPPTATHAQTLPPLLLLSTNFFKNIFICVVFLC